MFLIDMYPDPGLLASETSSQMLQFNLSRFLSGKKCSSICPEKTPENSIQMVSAHSRLPLYPSNADRKQTAVNKRKL